MIGSMGMSVDKAIKYEACFVEINSFSNIHMETNKTIVERWPNFIMDYPSLVQPSCASHGDLLK